MAEVMAVEVMVEEARGVGARAAVAMEVAERVVVRVAVAMEAMAMEVAAMAGWPAFLPGRRLRIYTRKLGFP